MLAAARQHRVVEVQAGRRRGDRAGLARIDGLIALASSASAARSMYGGSGIEPCCSKYGERLGARARARTDRRGDAMKRASHAAGQRDRHLGCAAPCSHARARGCAVRRARARAGSRPARRSACCRRTRAGITRVSLNTSRSPARSSDGRSAKRRSRSARRARSRCSSGSPIARRGPLCDQIFGQVVGEVGAPHGARTVALHGLVRQTAAPGAKSVPDPVDAGRPARRGSGGTGLDAGA